MRFAYLIAFAALAYASPLNFEPATAGMAAVKRVSDVESSGHSSGYVSRLHSLEILCIDVLWLIYVVKTDHRTGVSRPNDISQWDITTPSEGWPVINSINVVP
jgi:hypothetical protein